MERADPQPGRPPLGQRRVFVPAAVIMRRTTPNGRARRGFPGAWYFLRRFPSIVTKTVSLSASTTYASSYTTTLTYRHTVSIVPRASSPDMREDEGGPICPLSGPLLPIDRTVMTGTHFAEGQILFREGDPSDGVFRLLSGAVEVVRELDGDLILLGRVGAGQFIGEMRVVENAPRSATVRAASEVEAEFFNPTEFLDQIIGSPRTARELIQRLSQRLREADDRIANDERRTSRANDNWKRADNYTAVSLVHNVYLAAKSEWLQQQLETPFGLGQSPFVVGRRPVTGEGSPLWQPDLLLEDIAPFRLSRNHFVIEMRDGGHQVRDLCSTLGTSVNGQPIGNHFGTDHAPLRAGENEVIAGGADSPFVFAVAIA
jgi:CRP/FNR family transcriptional regulator, cyclic AMP receptor protein